jgi:hypothetical protein
MYFSLIPIMSGLAILGYPPNQCKHEATGNQDKTYSGPLPKRLFEINPFRPARQIIDPSRLKRLLRVKDIAVVKPAKWSDPPCNGMWPIGKMFDF